MSTRFINRASMNQGEYESGLISLGSKNYILVTATVDMAGAQTNISAFTLTADKPILYSGGSWGYDGTDNLVETKFAIFNEQTVNVTMTKTGLTYGTYSVFAFYDTLNLSPLFPSASSQSINQSMFQYTKDDIKDLFLSVFSQKTADLKPVNFSQQITYQHNSGGSYTLDKKNGVFFGQLEVASKGSVGFTLGIAATISNAAQNVSAAEVSRIDFSETTDNTTAKSPRQIFTNVMFDKLVVVNSDPTNVNVTITFKGYFIPYNV